MTSVLGHLTESDFGPGFRDWKHPPPERLFDVPIIHGVAKVSKSFFLQPGRRVESRAFQGEDVKDNADP